MAGDQLGFEAPLVALQKEIEVLTGYPEDARKEQEVARLQEKLDQKRREIYSQLTAWQKVQVARHPQRPYFSDYVALLFRDFIEIHGDRRFADDPAIVAGMAWYHERPVFVLGHQKGRDTNQKIYRNFGMPKPEGYRKALRVMQLAEKFSRPIFAFVDTPGAYPGLDAEERGQAEAIAHNIREIARIDTPIVVTITGEGGSGGALAIAVGDEILMLEHSIYSVISPEGCAAILWKDASQAETAAQGLKLTAQDLISYGLIDEIVPEPPGGAHSDPTRTAEMLDDYLSRSLARVDKMPPEERREARYRKFRQMGAVSLEQEPS
ncbi:MAG TPA: acetyl-CoA carboxylase carboxyltransferase subunit alpha [Vicinamibacteria bacterium]|jgi:acetyl-CoA carboxylase carboxyl transferase subunit alpha